jgi:hypothetical protein
MRLLMCMFITCFFPFTASAQDAATIPDPNVDQQNSSPPDPAQQPPVQQPPAQQPTAHPAATTYSNGYQTRLKIHKYASYATLPLFATELALGQSLYNNPDTGGRKTAHAIVGTGIVSLFAVNGVTGVWNLWEGWHDPDGGKVRRIHSLLMLASSGGILATEATGPHIRNGVIRNPGDKSLHRDLAVASISVGAAGYLLMLVKGK